MADRDYKAFIVEGEARKPLIIDNISKVFFQHGNFKIITLPAGENIYMLWKKLKEDDFDTDILEETEKIDRKEREKEFVMLNMRLCSGISFEEYRKAFGMEFEAKYGAAITPFLKSGHIVKNKQNISFTTKGFLLSNYILGQMIKF